MNKINKESKLSAFVIIRELESRYGKEKADKLISYLDMVLERNQFINLTAIKDRDEALEKHVLDSLSVTELPEYAEADRIIDIGTGAGFPGALLAIVSPEKEFTLMDSTLKRLKVIDEFTSELGISNAHTVHARAEEVSRKPDYNAAYDMCVTRAAGNLEKLAGWCLPFIRKGGLLVAYKGENYREEIDAAAKAIKKNGGRLNRVVQTDEASGNISGHVLVLIEKIK